MSLQDILKLPPSDRLNMVEQIWESIKPEDIEIPTAQKEELDRITPIIKALVKEFPHILISVDTFRSKIAKECVQLGACMINDISAGSLDKNMFATVAELQVPYILMHMQGTPQTMQAHPTYKDVISDILYYFSEKISELRALKVNDIIIDVGFGFGKTLEHNYE